MTNDLAARKTHWRDNVEAVGAAIVLALLLKAFALEAYKIPTGSMQPTLMGMSTPTFSVSDRIVVDKYTYTVRDPERFEVAVFRYPLDRAKNFVKRIVGMPNEDLRIANGDVWRRADASEPWSIVRRPDAVQEEHWKDLADPWVVEAGDLVNDGTALVAKGSGIFRFGRRDEPIMDRFFDGYPSAVRKKLPGGPDDPVQPAQIRDRFKVGDLRVSGDAVASAETIALDLVLTEGPRTYRFRLPGPASKTLDRPVIEVETDSARGIPGDAQVVATPNRRADAAWTLPAGRPVRVTAQNLDDRLRLEIEGGPTLELDVPPVTSQDARIRVAFTGPGRLEEPRVWRDVYYTARGRSEWTIPDDCYVMLGDNTQDSSDSREWEFDRFEVEEGGEVAVVRGNRRKDENPIQVGGRDQLYFVDEYGQRHWLDTSGGEPADGFVAATKLPPEPASFVQRDLITGRAIAVFWPIKIPEPVRLKWVH